MGFSGSNLGNLGKWRGACGKGMEPGEEMKGPGDLIVKRSRECGKKLTLGSFVKKGGLSAKLVRARGRTPSNVSIQCLGRWRAFSGTVLYCTRKYHSPHPTGTPRVGGGGEAAPAGVQRKRERKPGYRAVRQAHPPRIAPTRRTISTTSFLEQRTTILTCPPPWGKGGFRRPILHAERGTRRSLGREALHSPALPFFPFISLTRDQRACLTGSSRTDMR